MKNLIKKVECGKYTFNVGTDRSIVLKSLQEFPDFAEFIFDKNNLVSKEKDEGKFLLDLIKKGEAEKLFSFEDNLPKIIKFALPLMLKKAEEEINANEIIDYVVENEAEEIVYPGLFEFLMQGFTQRGREKKPKITFSMK